MRARAGSRVVAERYAHALLEVALDRKADVDRIGSELADVAALLRKETHLADVLSSPAIPAPKRVEILSEVLGKGLSKAAQSTNESSLAENVLCLLAANERMGLVDELSAAFRNLVLEHQRIQPGEVVSAYALDSNQRDRLAKSLGKALGKTMELGYAVDPSLVGGLVVRIGNRIFDASVTTQLRRFKDKALSGL